MPIRFYRRLRAGPFRINLSRSGLSASVGGRGAWITASRNGIRRTIGIPGSGLYWTDLRRRQPSAASAPTSAAVPSLLRRVFWVFGVLMIAGIAINAIATLIR